MILPSPMEGPFGTFVSRGGGTETESLPDRLVRNSRKVQLLAQGQELENGSILTRNFGMVKEGESYSR